MLKTIELQPLVGTEVRVDRAKLISGAHSDQIRELISARGLVLIRNLKLTEDEQLELTNTLGKAEEQDGGQRIYKVSLDPMVNPAADMLKATFLWHMDNTTVDAEVPSGISLLSARNLPESGGTTQWANTCAAYESLSNTERDDLAGLVVIHDQQAMQGKVYPEPTLAQVLRWHERPQRKHPLVWRYSDGRRSLVVSSGAFHVEGMTFRESYRLLCRLRELVTQPQFVYSHDWRTGDLIVWENLALLHRAMPYSATSGRLIQGSSTCGEQSI